jgi:hypothetical protein
MSLNRALPERADWDTIRRHYILCIHQLSINLLLTLLFYSNIILPDKCTSVYGDERLLGIKTYRRHLSFNQMFHSFKAALVLRPFGDYGSARLDASH